MSFHLSSHHAQKHLDQPSALSGTRAVNEPRIDVRMDLDFGLDGDIPRYWYGNDPFKTRLFDAMSTTFPSGELFFISCVRDFRDRITQPGLQADIKAFSRQEGQHSMVHERYNARLREQGVDVDGLEAEMSRVIDGFYRRHLPKRYNLALTAAAEHLTAIMAHSFTPRRAVMESMHPKMLALYAWHAMEEIEHKAVAFDVLREGARGGYFLRVLAMLHMSVAYPFVVTSFVRSMLKSDGFTRWQRWRMHLKGLVWMYGPGGLFAPLIGHYLRYYLPGFHPGQARTLASYRIWSEAWQATRDPLAASRAMFDAST